MPFSIRFYRSPMISGAADNSFSSDMSVPQFKIFNSESSPASSNQPLLTNTTPRPKAKSHLKQVTNASGGTDDDEEFVIKNMAKRVHFMDDSENKLSN